MYSEPGRGTRFKGYLPCAIPEAAVQAPGSAVTAPVKQGSETVLLVEDEAGVAGSQAHPRDALSCVRTCNGTKREKCSSHMPRSTWS